jgi:hypothetical protein
MKDTKESDGSSTPKLVKRSSKKKKLNVEEKERVTKLKLLKLNPRLNPRLNPKPM